MEVNYIDLLYSRLFNEKTNVEQEITYFRIDNNVIGTSGSFVTLVGLPKAGKSTFLTSIISSALIDKPVFNFELKLHPYLKKNKIAWFDTEQSAFDFNRSIKKVKEFTGMDDQIYQYLDCFLVNADHSKNIIGMIEAYLINVPNCGILVIDGLLDLIDNFNDEAASKQLIRRLKKWAKDHKILIVTILHLGKKDLTSIGHLGSAADRYAQSVLNIEKTKNNSYVLSAKMLRSAPGFNPIEIYYNNLTNKFTQSFT